MIIEQTTRSILPPCPTHGMWGSRKTSWDGPANKKIAFSDLSKINLLKISNAEANKQCDQIFN